MEKQFNNYSDKSEQYYDFPETSLDDMNKIAKEVKEAILGLNQKSQEELESIYKSYFSKTNQGIAYTKKQNNRETQ